MSGNTTKSVVMENSYILTVIYTRETGRITKLMDRAFTQTKRVLATKANGKRISSMGKVSRHGLKVPSMRASMSWVRRKVLESILGPMGLTTVVNG